MILRAATLQFESMPDAKAVNLHVLSELARSAAGSGAQLIAAPEMCSLGYWHVRRKNTAQLFDVAEPADGPTVTEVQLLAAEVDAMVGVGFLERDGSRLYNSYAVCSPGGEVAVHRKLHAFEHPAISSGDRYTVLPTRWGISIGVLICWDNNLIENPRATALLGASVLLAPHQTGGTASASPHATKVIPRQQWERRHTDPAAVEAEFRGPNGRQWLLRWLPSRAHDNGMFVLFSNGVGVDDDEIRTGNAMIIDPYGRILAETSAPENAVVMADLDLELVPTAQGRRWMRGRRPELYGPLTTPTGLERDAAEARFSTEPFHPDGPPPVPAAPPSPAGAESARVEP